MTHRFGRIAWLFRYLPASLLAVYAEHEVLSLARAVSVRGFDVRLYMLDEQEDHVVERLDRALELIEEYDPRRLQRIRSDVPTIVIWSRPQVVYWPWSNAIVMTAAYLVQRSSAMSAAAIVHEGTHGRHRKMGVYGSRELLSRIERSCAVQERDFARQLQRGGYPGTEGFIAALESRCAKPS